ncbi:hypothetical protein [Variovorax sp. IB41]|uniref:hypothetical protein n=1 Tax=Variovorax sp. IB41 TaxID=2779370 RepID=UPI0018E7DEBA|nr:hypothetical protein [Variovorax sp. IB41]MBJ2154745.1 hypothetical protein [Variovorax sp. IB41]
MKPDICPTCSCAQIVAGWAQFAQDLAAYVPSDTPTIEKVVAEPVEALPAPFVQVTGQLALQDNFKVFEERLREFLATKLIREPKTDEDFVNLDAQIKAMKEERQALKAAKAQMLAQVQPAASTARRRPTALPRRSADPSAARSAAAFSPTWPARSTAGPPAAVRARAASNGRTERDRLARPCRLSDRMAKRSPPLSPKRCTWPPCAPPRAAQGTTTSRRGCTEPCSRPRRRTQTRCVRHSARLPPSKVGTRTQGGSRAPRSRASASVPGTPPLKQEHCRR